MCPALATALPKLEDAWSANFLAPSQRWPTQNTECSPDPSVHPQSHVGLSDRAESRLGRNRLPPLVLPSQPQIIRLVFLCVLFLLPRCCHRPSSSWVCFSSLFPSMWPSSLSAPSSTAHSLVASATPPVVIRAALPDGSITVNLNCATKVPSCET